MINFGDTEFYKITMGDVDLTVYLGDVQIWPTSQPPYEEQYFTFEIISAGTILWKSYSNDRTIQYSKDKGATWTSITSSSIGEEINVNAGDKVLFRGDNAQYGIASNYYSTFSGSTAYFNAYGNIMSLIDSTGYTSLNTLAGQYNFRRFFGGTNVVDAGNLILPATTLTDGCYSGMFSNCHKLTTPPALPATTLTYQCYYYMFENDESLTTAPELPATTLARYCYEGLFQYCTSLTTAPDLPASTLLERCYRLMFRGCSSLNYIKCLATDISAYNCTNNWVDGVALTGTFVKSSSMTGWTTGSTSGIPFGWTVQNDCNPVVLYDNLGNTNNQGYSKSGFYTFDSTVTAITPCTYDFSGITCICARDDAFYSTPNAFLGKSNGGMSTNYGCLKSVQSIEIDCTTVTTLAYPFGNDRSTQFCQTVTSITLTNTDRVTTIRQLVRYCTNLVNLSIGSFANISTVGDEQFTTCPSLTNLSIDALPAMNITTWGFHNLANLTEQSVINILNALPTGYYSIYLGSTNINKLTSAAGQQALADAQNKGWNVY